MRDEGARGGVGITPVDREAGGIGEHVRFLILQGWELCDSDWAFVVVGVSVCGVSVVCLLGIGVCEGVGTDSVGLEGRGIVRLLFGQY